MKNYLVPAHVEDDALSALINVLERVKANGGKLNDSGIWFGADGPYGCLDELKALKTHKKTLLCLRKALEKRIIPVQNACNELTMQTGIQSVPVEILQEILVASHFLAKKGNEQSISVSQVCRRFRTVALRTPELWSTVSSVSPLAETREFLKRSASAPLTIEFPYADYDRPHALINAFLDVVSPHASRWIDLDITVMDEPSIPVFPGDLHLPLLESLRHVPATYDGGVVRLFSDHCRRQFLWPTLCSYTAVNLVTKIDTPCNNLRECRFAWQGFSIHSQASVDISMLLDALQAMPNLTDLSLKLDVVSPTARPIPPEAMVYPSITTFTLCVGRGYTVNALLDRLLKSFRLPNIVDFTLEYSEPMSFGDTMKTRLNNPKGPIPFQTLQRLRIFGSGDSHGELEASLDLCECLLELSMEGVEDPLCVQPPPNSTGVRALERPCPLQTLLLGHCDDVTADEIRLLIDQLRQGPNWETFRRLEITCCKELTEDFFLSIEDEMEGKLVWTTCG